MTRDEPTRRLAPLLALIAALVLLPSAAWAQAVDCSALRAEIDAAGSPSDPGRFEVALRQQRDEIARTRAYADQSGCGDGFFDDPDSPQCRSLARRIVGLETSLQRLQDQAARGDPSADDHRRGLTETYNAQCTTERAGLETAPETMPVNPDAVPAPEAPAPLQASRSPVVMCVRQCDGAYYPLANDVPSDRLGDMDRLCQAQCPAATSSAYAGRDSDDIAGATATDGTRYADLSTAFQFRKSSTSTCACRAPKQSWAEALAGAEAMLEPHKGDVTVTPALAAEMARPVSPPTGSIPPLKSSTSRKTGRKSVPPVVVTPPGEALQPPTDRDLTRQFRRSDPTL
ncbi:MAG: DUF2865 domain-containing protein [Janthinobacterium lividum]